jgi:transposase
MAPLRRKPRRVSRWQEHTGRISWWLTGLGFQRWHSAGRGARPRPPPIALKARSGFEITVAAGIAGAGLPLAVVNAAQVGTVARATGRLAKTDGSTPN